MPLEFWPYCIFAIAFVLGGFFTQSRAALLALLLALFTLLLGWFGLHRFDQTRLDAAVLTASIYVPALTVLFHFLHERGLWSVYGAVRSVGVILAIFVFFILSEVVMDGCATTMRHSVWLRQVSVWMPLPLLGLVALAGALGVLQIRRPAESPLLGIFLSAMLTVVFAGLAFRAFVDQPQVAGGLLFGAMTLAGMILIGAVLESTWRHAYIDELTELPSRRALKSHCARLGYDYTIAMVDIDHFKAVNDRYGHATGDQVLRFLASRLRNNGIGRVYRQGGEEFVVVTENMPFADVVTALDKVRAAIAERPFGIRDPLSRPARVDKNKTRPAPAHRPETITITVSIGVAHSTQDHTAPDEVLALADKALYRAKADGRNRVCTIR